MDFLLIAGNPFFLIDTQPCKGDINTTGCNLVYNITKLQIALQGRNK